MPVIKALRTAISDGSNSYPIFLGYLSAEELETVAAVPSFDNTSKNYEIAENVLGDPVEDWQRPPIEEKVEAIKTRFGLAAEIMPNPVLIAVNDESLVKVKQQQLNGQHTELFEISVDVPPGREKPLWILDGQHRVLGLARSARRDNPVPLVLLHSDTLSVYAPRQFAKIFAEVTTLATPLHAIHSEWLQFAFNLGSYSSRTTPDWLAMKTVADLCRLQSLPDGAANPFFDKVAFNPGRGAKPAIAKGFEFTCTELKDLIRDNYFGVPSAGKELLSPGELAVEIAQSILSLARADSTTTTRSAFFGDAKFRQKYMEEGFVVGVLTYLHQHGAGHSWATLLDTLGFTTANWDFTGWVVTTGGNMGSLSKGVARDTFRRFFGAGQLPAGVGDIPTYLRGDSAQIVLRSSVPTPSGRAKKHGYVDHELPVSGVKKLDMGTRRHLKLGKVSANIGQLEIREARDVFSTAYSARVLRRGIALPSGGGRLELLISASLYGGTKPPPLTLEVTWS